MSQLERIVAACGGILLDHGARALIPGPDHSAEDRSVSLIETEDGRILIHCFSPRDNWRDVRTMLLRRGLLEGAENTPTQGAAAAPARPVSVQPGIEDRVSRARSFWDAGRPLRGTVAERYLAARAIGQDVAQSGALRFHPRMTSIDDAQRRPALLAAIVNAEGVVQGVQATLLSVHGAAKAPLATPRRVIGKLMGGSVRLHEPGSALLIGEGVETMLSAAALLDLPAWAALSAVNLSQFEPPAGVTRLVVAIDNDAAGEAAFAKLEARLGAMVERAPAPNQAGDWNDAARMFAER